LLISSYEKGEHLKITKEASPMSVQIIPNVGRIKIEKVLVTKYILNGREDDKLPEIHLLTKQERETIK
jgi:hypothetical protein